MRGSSQQSWERHRCTAIRISQLQRFSRTRIESVYQLEGDSASTGLADVDVEEDTATLALCHCWFGV